MPSDTRASSSFVGVARPARVVSLCFTGDRSISGGLTWGQRWIWDEIQSTAPKYQQLNIPVVLDVPQDCALHRIVDAVRNLVERYEVLRSRYGTDEHGEPRQTVARSGRIDVGVYEADCGGREPAEALVRSWKDVPFDLSEWPIRMAVVMCGDRPSYVVMVLFHMAADGWAAAGLIEELSDMMRSGRPSSMSVGGGGRHPVDRAQFESSREGGRLSESSFRYWREQLERFPRSMLEGNCLAPMKPRFQEARIVSPAMYSATCALAARYKVSQPSVVLALTAVILAARANSSRCGLLVYSGNRFSDNDGTGSGSLVQDVPLCIDVESASVGEYLQRTWRSTMSAYMFGRYNQAKIDELVRAFADSSGTLPDLSCTVNLTFDRRSNESLSEGAILSDPASIMSMMSETRIEVGDAMDRDRSRRKFYLIAYNAPSGSEITVRGDTAVLSLADLTGFLETLEWLAVETLVNHVIDHTVTGEMYQYLGRSGRGHDMEGLT
jgi:hypothetical protein